MGGTQRSLIALLRGEQLAKFAVTVLIISPGGVLEDQIPTSVRVIYGYDWYQTLGSDGYGSLRRRLLSSAIKCRWRDVFYSLRQAIYSKFYVKRHPEELVWKIVRRHVPIYPVEYDVGIAFMQGTASYFLIEKFPHVRVKILEFNTDFETAGYSTHFNEVYFRQADAIVNVSAEGQAQLQRLFPTISDRIKFIPHELGIEQTLCDGAVGSQDIEHDFTGLRLVSVSRLVVEAKGYDLIVDAARVLHQSGTQFRWWIIGDGPGMNWIKTQIERLGLRESVILTRALLDPYPLMSSAHILVHASRLEGSSRVVKEAMTLGVPVVLTNYPSARMEYKDGHHCLITSMDGDSIARSIVRLHGDQKLQQLLAANAKSNLETSYLKYPTLLQQLLASNRNRRFTG